MNVNDVLIIHKLRNILWLTVKINQKALDKLKIKANSARVVDDIPVRSSLTESLSLINADDAFSAGFTGSGVTVAALDTGIVTNQPDLMDDFVWAGCFLLDGGCLNELTTTRASGPGATAG